MINNKVLVYSLILSCLISFSNFVSASEQQQSHVVRIVGNEFKEPKIYMNNGQAVGVLVDILRYIESKSDIEFDIKLYPWKRAYEKAKNAEAAIVGLSMTKERLEIFDYTDPIYYDEVVLVVLKGQEFKFDDIEDLKGKIIGGTAGASYGDEYNYGAEHVFKLDPAGTYPQKLLKLLNGHLDAVAVSPGRYALDAIINEDQRLIASKHKFSILPKPLARDPNYIGFAKKNEQKKYLKDINKVLKNGYGNRDIEKIISKWNK